jgi:hypothetical protein
MNEIESWDARRPGAAPGRRRRYFTTSNRTDAVKIRCSGVPMQPWAACRSTAWAGRGSISAPIPTPIMRTRMRPPATLAVKLRANLRRACASHEPASTPGSRIMYQSDITQFINQMKEKNPKLESEQRQGRALLWDKQPIDLDERKKQSDSRVQQTSYVYYQNF